MRRIGYSIGSSLIGALVLAGSLGTANAVEQPPFGAEIKGFNGLEGECLDVFGGKTDNGTPVIAFPCHGGTNQQWIIKDGQIRGVQSGKCLDVTGANPADGTQIIIWPCKTPFTTGAANQTWRVVNGRIRGLANKCLDIKFASTDPATPVILFQCKPFANALNQRWTVE